MFTIVEIRPNKLIFVVLLALAVALGVAFGVNRTSAGEVFETIEIGKTINVGDLTVVVERLHRGENETRLELSFNSESAIGVGPVGLPSIRLPDGRILKGEGLTGAFNIDTGKGLLNRTYRLPGIPEGVKEVTVDLASHVAYYDSRYSVALPLEGILESIDHASVTELEVYTIGKTFSINSAQYELTSLVLRDSLSSFSFRPLNEDAQSLVVSGTLSHVGMRDNLGTKYPSGLSLAKWGNNQDSVRSQSLFFNGTISAEATVLTLDVDGVGEIKTPGSIQVSLP